MIGGAVPLSSWLGYHSSIIISQSGLPPDSSKALNTTNPSARRRVQSTVCCIPTSAEEARESGIAGISSSGITLRRCLRRRRRRALLPVRNPTAALRRWAKLPGRRPS
jgi:hypothetical protein